MSHELVRFKGISNYSVLISLIVLLTLFVNS